MANTGSNDLGFSIEFNGISHVINMTSSSRDITDKVTGNLINSGELKTGHTLNANPIEVVFEWESTIQGNNLATETQAHHVTTNVMKDQLLQPMAEIEEQPTNLRSWKRVMCLTAPIVAETQLGIERKRKPSMCIADLFDQPCKRLQI